MVALSTPFLQLQYQTQYICSSLPSSTSLPRPRSGLPLGEPTGFRAAETAQAWFCGMQQQEAALAPRPKGTCQCTGRPRLIYVGVCQTLGQCLHARKEGLLTVAAPANENGAGSAACVAMAPRLR